ncbi:transcription factor domain-containing protein [Aspergillus glaucus CBS 516.65]|uniref:C2H2-type domain-containing protein n=1 Tax=Aspergillus glaucus CBS 516.65 TaxID=1160497 RepID=A0A1L9VNA0_ASPGL|nr:hypothetical protein ASPGLDRAFT_168509 [Aspergillus glaucus CBS 516.65]OJJ85407.1 hypothetical protein ASPGLDRAFT_168509 [Aspergillus glaucus CBS 516.65]
MAANTLQCDICLAQFSRPDHLRRHSASHEDQRPYECNGCKRSFKRSDALKRHERTCRALFTSPDDITKDDNRPWKRICHATEPDRNEHPDGLTPQSPDIGGLINQPIRTPENEFLVSMSSGLDFTALDWLYPPSLEPDITLAERLEYLAYFTSARGMATFLDRETLRRKQDMISGYYDTITSTINEDKYDQDDDLLPKSTEIINCLKSTVTTDSSTIVAASIPSWTLDTHRAATEFFSPSNIHRLLTFFWALWYPTCPFVHRPFFNPANASPALLAVVVIIGACISPDEEDGKRARKWMDPVEVITFRQEWFTDAEQAPKPGDGKWKKRLECIQTAYLVCSLQKREGSAEAQGRVRRYRHAMMVSLAREIGLSTATHPRTLPAHASDEWWRQFAAEEEMVRTLTYVFLFDAALTIFHNSPPRMVVSELRMDMACPETCFQAESAEECLSELGKWSGSVFWRERLSVASVVRRMCQPRPQAQASEEQGLVLGFSQIGTLNLFTTVQCLHSLTFHLQNSLITLPSPLTPLQTGLENWRRTWNKRIPEDSHIPHRPDTLWKQIGFARYAPEFWQLARILVMRLACSSGDFADGDGEGGLGGYDHTDMEDINGLIEEYRRMSLGGCM